VVSTWIDENLDHRMLLHQDDPMVPVLREHNEPVFLMDANPTAENIAKLIYEFTASRGFPIVESQLWETPHCVATYRA
jgi:6-pyruvoyltetrahydropterin/6-carboxytetrahydropterin synthase